MILTIKWEQDALLMRVIAKRVLREFWERHPDSEQQLKAWYAEAKNTVWHAPADIKAKYGTASILKDSRVVFNICGNKVRLAVKINYPHQVMYIRFVGTHEQYDAIDAEMI